MADELHLLAIGWIFVRKTWSRVPCDWLNGLIYSYTYVSVVLISNISDIAISISTRRTEDFDNLVLVLMLMSRLSSLRHKTRYAYVYAYVVVRTRLERFDYIYKCPGCTRASSKNFPASFLSLVSAKMWRLLGFAWTCETTIW